MIKNKPIIKIALFLFGIVFLFSYVSAVECGSVPVDGCIVSQNTNFTTGTYNLANGIDISVDSIILDCQGSTLIGTNTGIEVFGSDNLIIKNCILKNYAVGIYLKYSGTCPSSLNAPQSNKIINNSIYNSSRGVDMGGGLCTPGGERYSNNNNFVDNYFFGNDKGAFIFNSRNSNLTGNSFVNNTQYGIHFAQAVYDSVVYNNSFYNNSIRYDETNNNRYCLNNQYPNHYFDGATGPMCGCIIPLNGFKVTSDETFCRNNYTLPDGFNIGSSINLDCNGSLLTGQLSGNGISTLDSSQSIVSNCIIENYTRGIYMNYANICGNGLAESSSNSFYNNILRKNSYGAVFNGAFCNTIQGFGVHSVDNNKLINNTIINNTRGIYGIYTKNNNISLNNIQENSFGVEFDQNGVLNNKIYHNNFIQNNISAKVSNLSYSWNISGEGNYWTDYDSSGEGCLNANFDQFCDSPYNISGSVNATDYFPYVVQDGWLLGPQASSPLPVQVIADVDMVKGKSTLIRIPITFTSVLTNDTITPNVTVYWNGTFVGQNLVTSFTYNQTKNVDFWYVPSNTGNNVPISVVVSGTSANGINYTDGNSRNVNIVWTRNLTLTFVPVDNPDNFQHTAESSLDYLYKTYPLNDQAIISRFNYTNIQSTAIEHNTLGLYLLMHKIHKSTLIAGQLPERSVGVVPTNWFADNLNKPGVRGVSLRLSSSVLVEQDFADVFHHLSAHELGHTYGLCDEYNETAWANQNNGFFTTNYCPNGDLNNDEVLDDGCVKEGCPTSTLEPLNGLPDGFPVHNFMGSTVTINTWISKDSYLNLLTEFNHSTPVPADKRAVISGVINLTSKSITFDNFYTLDYYGLGENPKDHTSGDYSLQILNSSNGLLYNISFEASGVTFLFNDSTIDNNETAFAFTVPFNFSASSIVLKYNGTIKATKNISNNAPNISLIYPYGGQKYSNEQIIINWTAYDPDPNTNLSYAVLFSSDNGTNYNTMIFDYNNSSFNLSSNSLEDGRNYKVKVLVTDGLRTNESIINQSFEIDNDLQIRNFSIVYQNNTERIFKIILNNTFSQTISNISWEFNSGESIQNSVYNLSLQPAEESWFFIYHNYSSAGNYNVSFKAQQGIFRESESINVII